MDHTGMFCIGGTWVDPYTTEALDVMNPATDKTINTMSLAGPADVQAAVAAPRQAHLNSAGADINAPASASVDR